LIEVKIDDLALELTAGAQSRANPSFWRVRDDAV
jgi:hypothetical protein